MMSVSRTMSLTEARKNFFALSDKVKEPGVVYTFTEKGTPASVLMSAELFESWAETLDILSEYPDLHKRIARAERDLAEGKTISFEELKKKHGL